MLRLFIVKNFRRIPQRGWRTHGEGQLCGVPGGGALRADPHCAAHRRDSGRGTGRDTGRGMGRGQAGAGPGRGQVPGGSLEKGGTLPYL